MQNHLSNLIPDSSKILFALLSTWVLFAVFFSSAIAFILTIFGVLTPDVTTKRYLFGLFAASTVGIFANLVTNNLIGNPVAALDKITTSAVREQAFSNAPMTGDKMTVFVQISSNATLGTYANIKSVLPKEKYIVPPVDTVGFAISGNTVRYCNTANNSDAQNLSDFLKERELGNFKVVNIHGCDPKKNKNILEIWIQSS